MCSIISSSSPTPSAVIRRSLSPLEFEGGIALTRRPRKPAAALQGQVLAKRLLERSLSILYTPSSELRL